MNNFADDEFTEKDAPDLDMDQVKAETAVADETLEPEDDDSGFLNRRWVKLILRTAFGLWALGTALGVYWNRFPRTFNVEQKATTMALTEGHREEGETLPSGYRFVSTLVYLAEEKFLDKPGGLMSNDLNPVSRLTDNMRSWEKGFVFQYRITLKSLLEDLSRAGNQSQVHKPLQSAFSYFNFEETSFVLPSSEKQYRSGLDSLRTYLQQMSESESEAAYFAARQDQLISYLRSETRMLGNYTSQLQRNIEPQPYDTGVLKSTESDIDADTPSDQKRKSKEVNDFLDRDNAFYEVRGGVFVMYHCMLAIRKDCEGLINDANAMGVMNRILNELESANKPMHSPVVLNGKEFGVVQNHSLVLASHLAKAHLAMQELQQQLAGGSL